MSATTSIDRRPLADLVRAAESARRALGLAHRPVVVRDEASALAIAGRTRAGALLLGEGAFWVVSLADAVRLERAGYERAPRPRRTHPHGDVPMRTVEITGIEFPSAHEAIQHCDASGRGEAIIVGGRCLVVEQGEADRLAAAGAQFAYLGELPMPDGSSRIVTVPVN